MANDVTAACTVEHGQVAVFVAVDHASAECAVSLPPCTAPARGAGADPPAWRRAFRQRREGRRPGLAIRHDHGSQCMSRDFQREIAWLGATSSPAFIRAPEGKDAPNG
jgi:putative transposase